MTLCGIHNKRCMPAILNTRHIGEKDSINMTDISPSANTDHTHDIVPYTPDLQKHGCLGHDLTLLIKRPVPVLAFAKAVLLLLQRPRKPSACSVTSDATLLGS